MTKRRKIRIYDGWPGKHVEFEATYESGATQVNTCSLEEWEIYEIMDKLVAQGADEKLVEDLRSRAYSAGYDEAGMDYAENEGY